ncbi:MAG TPA: methyltransferase domain-containing protein [Nannocystis exedens]|nr:methyltransferase domain-containing protein [Nannocystis exedens]
MTMLQIIDELRRRRAGSEQTICLRVLNPDHGRGHYAGERIEINGQLYTHRPLRLWLDLAERLGLRLLLPRRVDEIHVELHFEVMESAETWRREGPVNERYGQGSAFQRICKLEEANLVADVADALDRIDPPANARVLGLGINRGDEFALLCALRPELAQSGQFVGIDHCASALGLARTRFPSNAFSFIEADINDLPSLELGTFDLVIAFGTLQSPAVRDRELLRHLSKERLGRQGALLLGIPNCRYADGEQLYGARMRNYRQPDLSLLLKDIAYYRRYLQQHRRQVYVTGKYDLILTAVPIKATK